MIITQKLFRGKFIRNYRNGNDILLVHVDKTKPIWLFRNFFEKKATLEKVTRTQAAAFIQEIK